MDITGITLPVTKHNYLVTRATDIPGVVREAFHVARSGRPGPVLIDITKDAQQTSVEVPAPREPRRSRLPAARAGEAELDRAAAFVETAAEVIGLREIDFRVIGSGRTGPVTRTLQTAYHSLVRGEHPLSAQWLTPVPAVAVAAVG